MFPLPALRTNLRKRLVKMPKSFYDRLVCWLRPPAQQCAAPEAISNLLVSECDPANKVSARTSSTGPEGGIALVSKVRRLTLVDQVDKGVSPFDDSKRIRRHLARSAGPCPVAVVYGGDQPQRRGADTLIPWRELHRLDWQVPDRGVVV